MIFVFDSFNATFKLDKIFYLISLNHTCFFFSCRTLRPYPISSRRSVPANIDQPDWAVDVSC